ncbi:hypothetical protein [Dactylosporangium sp. NPDC051484]|uniref:hypothetical protein n=1 Tax=Dactylosporangium sp. NPDC051484 TaxID=3154942 RepID=UPI00344E86C2
MPRAALPAEIRQPILRVLQSAAVTLAHVAGAGWRIGSWLPARYAARDDPAGLRRLVPDVAEHEVFLCGPPPWMAAVRATLAACGVAAERIHTEEFAW